MRKALFWEQICFALSPQEGASGHHMLAATGDAGCKRDAQDEMLQAWPPWGRAATTAWLGKSFSLLLQ